MKGLIILLVSFSLLACNTFRPTPTKVPLNKTEFHETYSTFQTRQLWLVCSQKFVNYPHLTQEVIAGLCDCYCDTLKSSISFQELEVLDIKGSKEIGVLVSEKCPLPSIPIPTTEI